MTTDEKLEVAQGYLNHVRNRKDLTRREKFLVSYIGLLESHLESKEELIKMLNEIIEDCKELQEIFKDER